MFELGKPNYFCRVRDGKFFVSPIFSTRWPLVIPIYALNIAMGEECYLIPTTGSVYTVEKGPTKKASDDDLYIIIPDFHP
jgi:hypothetical protein